VLIDYTFLPLIMFVQVTRTREYKSNSSHS